MTDEVVVVCMRITTPLIMPDNRLGKCSACGWRIQFRPDVPPGRKLCMECTADRIEPDAKVMITPRTLAEARDYFRKKRQ